MARRILQIEAMTTEDCTFSVGVIHAGQWVNCVASECRAEVLSMAKTQADLDRGVAAMLALQGERDGVEFTVTRGVTRPVWEPQPGTMALYDLARDLSAQIGFELSSDRSGGGSDGNHRRDGRAHAGQHRRARPRPAHAGRTYRDRQPARARAPGRGPADPDHLRTP